MEKINVQNLTFTYPGASRPVIKDLSFSLEAGDFLTVVGPSGTGKSTLLSLLKKELAPTGHLSGEILYDGSPLYDLPDRASAENIGFVFQDPDSQIVTDKVWHEMAFGLESLGMPAGTVRMRTAEVASFLGISDLFDRDVHTLSGGQKQLVNLASVLCMNPDLLLLDEPTAQLDPIASEEFMEILARLHRDTGITIILVEHRLESVAGHCNKLLILDRSLPAIFGDMESCIRALPSVSPVLSAFPASVRLYKSIASHEQHIPMTIAEGRQFILKNIGNRITSLDTKPQAASFDTPVIEIKDLSFGYERRKPLVLKDLDLTVYKGEIFTCLGGNGQGKSTLLSLMAGLISPDSGHISILGKNIKKYYGDMLYEKVAMLPQQVETLFLKDSVALELKDISEPAFPMDHLVGIHPYDLSGGEKALLGLNLVLARRPKILLLDEPTKGLDTENKRNIAAALKSLRDTGVTIFLITHDIELAAMISDRIGLLFDGCFASLQIPRDFFRDNFFYTTHFARMTRGIYTDVYLQEEAVALALKNLSDD